MGKVGWFALGAVGGALVGAYVVVVQVQGVMADDAARARREGGTDGLGV
jgi:hypothetical protein